jgi:hypothetical protein
VSYDSRRRSKMRKTLIAAVALVAIGASFAAAAAGGTHSTAQRVRIEVSGSSSVTFVLTPTSKGKIRRDTGPLAFCCWRSWNVTRAGAKLEVTNPQLTLTGKHGTLTIRERIEWVGLPDDWSVQTGTWKVVGGTGSRTGTYAGLSGHGRITSVWTHGGYLRVRLFGFLEPKH